MIRIQQQSNLIHAQIHTDVLKVVNGKRTKREPVLSTCCKTIKSQTDPPMHFGLHYRVPRQPLCGFASSQREAWNQAPDRLNIFVQNLPS